MTATQTTPAAVEAARAAVDPTAADENAHMLAGLIHTLGTRATAARYEAIANGKDLSERWEAMVPTEGGVVTQYDEADDGACEQNGRPCRSIEQVLENLEKRIEGLWQAARADQIARTVEEKLRDLQKRNLETLEKAPE